MSAAQPMLTRCQSAVLWVAREHGIASVLPGRKLRFVPGHDGAQLSVNARPIPFLVARGYLSPSGQGYALTAHGAQVAARMQEAQPHRIGAAPVDRAAWQMSDLQWCLIAPLMPTNRHARENDRMVLDAIVTALRSESERGFGGMERETLLRRRVARWAENGRLDGILAKLTDMRTRLHVVSEANLRASPITRGLVARGLFPVMAPVDTGDCA